MATVKVKNTRFGNRRYRGTMDDIKRDENVGLTSKYIPKARTYGAEREHGKSFLPA